MSRVFNGTSDKGVISAALLTSLASTGAFHIAAWAKSTSDAALQFVFGIGSSSDNDPVIVVGLDGTSTGDKLYALCRDDVPSPGASVMNTGNGYSVNTWHHLQLSNGGVAERYAWLDGNEASGASQTVSMSGAFTPTTTAVGVLKRAAENGFFAGKLARMTIWRSGTAGDLPSMIDRWLLSRGANPLSIKAPAIVYHWDDDLVAVTGGQSWTWTGTSTDSDNPVHNGAQTVASSVSSWEVPAGGVGSAGFTNTGLGWDSTNSELLVGDFTNTRIVRCSQAGAYIGEVVLGGSPPANSVQGVAWDSSDGSYWVCHYAATAGTIRRYNSSGALLQTISPGVANAGPNGCTYDPASDRILAVWENGIVRGYNCATGSLDETVTLATLSGHSPDGLAIDPSDPTVLWATLDTTASTDYIGKFSRSTGVMQWIMYGLQDPESMVFVGSTLWMCADAQSHSAVPNGNRVHQLDVSVGANATLVDGVSAVDSSAAEIVAFAGLSESAAAIDTVAASAARTTETSEEALGVDGLGSTSAGNASALDSVMAADLQSAFAILAAQVAEGVSVADLQLAAMIASAAATEAAAASDTASTATLYAGGVTEGAAVSDALTAAATMVAQVIEAGGVVEQLAAAQQLVALLTDAAAGSDLDSAVTFATFDVSLAELVAALDVLSSAIGGDPSMVPGRRRVQMSDATLARRTVYVYPA